MSIKNLKPNKNVTFKQGYYTPVNMNKYKGTYPIIYRSSWELKFCKWCDVSERVVFWASEPFAIKYFSLLDKKEHKYYPDFLIKMKVANEGQEILQDFIVEVKPKSQLVKPVEPKRKTIKTLKNYKKAYETYVINLCKSEALHKLGADRGAKVMYITEDSKLF